MGDEPAKPAETTAAPDPAASATSARIAAAAMVLGEVPWAFIIYGQFVEDEVRLVAWNGFVAASNLVLAALLLKGVARAYGIAVVACYYDVAASWIWAQQGTKFLWASAVLGLVGVAYASKARDALPRAADPKAPARPETFGQWLRENFEAIIVAFVMALVIRCFCIEVFKIPSASMQPTLNGDKANEELHQGGGGDRIMVTKYYYAFSPVERYDIVVFKFPLNQSRNFIKRVVGMPGEELMIDDGDIFVRPLGGKEDQDFQVARKPQRVQDAIWIEVPALPDPPRPGQPERESPTEAFKRIWLSGPPAEGRPQADFELQSGQLTTLESRGERGVTFRFNDSVRDDAPYGESVPIDDLRIAFDFEITGPRGQVFAEIINAYGRFALQLSTEGPGALHYHKPGSGNAQPKSVSDTVGGRLQMDRRHRVELAVFDGQVTARVDGDRATIPLFASRSKIERIRAPDRAITFGSRDVTFRVRNLSVGRDIHYRGKDDRSLSLREEAPVKIPAGSFMMMGDNVNNSHDSRMWTEYTYTVRDGRGQERTIRCEGQETTDSPSGDRSTIADLQKRLNLKSSPDVAIRADAYGNEWPLYHHPRKDEEDRLVIVGETKNEPFRLVEEKYVVGKAFWVWWPRGRWFRLIR